MAQLTSNQRIIIVEEMIKLKSLVKVKRYLQTHHGVKVSELTIKRTYDKWKQFGSIKNVNKGNSGRKKNVRTHTNIALVKELIESDASKSVRKLSAELNLKRESIRNILKEDLKLYPYKVQCFQHLSSQDKIQ